MKLTQCLLGFAMLLPASARAEEAIHWDDLTKIVNGGQHDRSREYTIVTKSDGKRKANLLSISKDGLILQTPSDYRPISRPQVLEVQVRHRGPLSYFGRILNQYCDGRCDEYGCLFDPVVLILLPVDLVYGAIVTPPLLPIEGIRRLLPAKVYKIVQ
jgi:hypothetical protein